MMRLIDADALEEEIRTKDIMGGLNYRSFIRNAPTIEMRRQEPCDDAISREDVIRKLRADTLFVCSGDKMQAISDIEGLPPVTQKSGEWIVYNYPGHECTYCSRCKAEFDQLDLYLGGVDYPSFCPSCGADMREGSE